MNFDKKIVLDAGLKLVVKRKKVCGVENFVISKYDLDGVSSNGLNLVKYGS